MIFSHVKISNFRAKAHLVFHWCLYNKIVYYMAFICSCLNAICVKTLSVSILVEERSFFFFLWCLITARKEVVFRTGYATKRMTVSCDAWTQVYSVRYLWRRKFSKLQAPFHVTIILSISQPSELDLEQHLMYVRLTRIRPDQDVS